MGDAVGVFGNSDDPKDDESAWLITQSAIKTGSCSVCVGTGVGGLGVHSWTEQTFAAKKSTSKSSVHAET